MKSFKLLVFVLLLLNSHSGKSQKSELWEDFTQAAANGTESILPDFSFAGYRYSEVAIPTVEHPIFDVTAYGAVPDDTVSDKNAIQKAIQIASKNGKGIVYFPSGKYYINTDDDDLQESISIISSHIVLRGEHNGKNRATLFFENNLPPKDPSKLWSTPYAIGTRNASKKEFITNIIGDSKRESYSIKVSDASSIRKGQWIILTVKNNSKELIDYDIGPLKADPAWTSILTKGVQVNEIHQVDTIDGHNVTFREPIHYDIQAKFGWQVLSFDPLEEIGFENLDFEGNWIEKFEHHKSAKHDGGWSILNISNAINSWVKNCKFRNVNNGLSFSASSACTALNITIEGNIGHRAVHAAGGSTGILLAVINDKAGMHHTTGVGGGSTTGTVIWRSNHPDYTCFESHASQPRCTLFDNVTGGFFQGRAGGARSNLPNHGRHLVLWNYRETDEPEEDFSFIAKDTWWWKIVPPIIVGFHGTGSSFDLSKIQVLESPGKPVQPESLFEAQLELRLGKLPDWIEEVKQGLN